MYPGIHLALLFAKTASIPRLNRGPQNNSAKAGNGVRTRDTELGKLVLYQLSYARTPTIQQEVRPLVSLVFPFREAPTGKNDET